VGDFLDWFTVFGLLLIIVGAAILATALTGAAVGVRNRRKERTGPTIRRSVLLAKTVPLDRRHLPTAVRHHGR
jgi:hypothetical protein